MRRRIFIAGLGAAVIPTALHAQQAMPAVGLLRTTTAGPFQHLLVALRQGLGEMGYVDGQNVTVEQRWADNQLDRLPSLARGLVDQRISAIVGNGPAIHAAKAITSTIPLVFVMGDDPVKSGLVSSLNRPGGNLTGVTFFGGSQLSTKRLDLLRDLVPKASLIAVLLDTNYAAFVRELPDVEAAARTLGQRIVTVEATRESELDTAFDKIIDTGAGGMLVSGGPFFTSQRQRIVALAARHAIPAIYDVREFVQAGGLISYSASLTDAYRRAGVYLGRILKGDSPAELPVQRATQFELAINLKTAKTLGIAVPLTLQAAADEVIE